MDGDPDLSADMTGRVPVTVNGEELSLFFGFTAIAELQGKHGNDFLQQLAGAASSETAMMALPFELVLDILRAALRRWHAEELRADPYLPDDILGQNGSVLERIMEAAIGGPNDVPGNRRAAGKKRASTSPRSSARS